MKIVILAAVFAYVAACPQTSIDMACALLKKSQSGTLYLSSRHVSGVSDQAYASLNIKYMCNGSQAYRSSYNCSACATAGAPGGSVCLTNNLLSYLTVVAAKRTVSVVELAGGCHSCGSRHYNGQAVDLYNDGHGDEYISTCTSIGGTGMEDDMNIHCHFYD